MSLAGLRLGAKARWNLSAPAETKLGSYIFVGDTSNTTTRSLAEDCNAQPGSGRSSLSGKGKWRGKGKGRGAQPEEEAAEDEERVADERAAYSMEEDEEDAF